MDLILWRHAEAEPGEPDLGRRLTSKGLKQAERMAEWLEHRLPETTRIIVSPADRTQQTALALGRKFKTSDDVAPGVLATEKGAWIATSPTGQTASALVSAEARADLGQGACYNDVRCEVAVATA